jgi:hypothetical protein
MSYECDEQYAVYEEKEVRARKFHKCSACGERILPLSRYFRINIVFDGSVETIKRCRRCQALHLHLRTLDDHQSFCSLWPDERLNCGEEYSKHWGQPPPPEIEALAFLTEQEKQALNVERAVTGG